MYEEPKYIEMRSLRFKVPRSCVVKWNSKSRGKRVKLVSEVDVWMINAAEDAATTDDFLNPLCLHQLLYHLATHSRTETYPPTTTLSRCHSFFLSLLLIYVSKDCAWSFNRTSLYWPQGSRGLDVILLDFEAIFELVKIVAPLTYGCISIFGHFELCKYPYNVFWADLIRTGRI